jgi:acetylornithine/succinyldiaminopimelate/putrescine aminotransferase
VTGEGFTWEIQNLERDVATAQRGVGAGHPLPATIRKSAWWCSTK